MSNTNAKANHPTAIEIDNGWDLSGIFETLDQAQAAIREEAGYSDAILVIRDGQVYWGEKKIGTAIYPANKPSDPCDIRGCLSYAYDQNGRCLFHRNRAVWQ